MWIKELVDTQEQIEVQHDVFAVDLIILRRHIWRSVVQRTKFATSAKSAGTMHDVAEEGAQMEQLEEPKDRHLREKEEHSHEKLMR